MGKISAAERRTIKDGSSEACAFQPGFFMPLAPLPHLPVQALVLDLLHHLVLESGLAAL